MTLSRKATLAKGAILGFLAPKLAQDAKVELAPILAGVTQANFGSRKGAIVAGVREAVKGKLAQDANIDGLTWVVDAVTPLSEEQCGGFDSQHGTGRGSTMQLKTAADGRRYGLAYMARSAAIMAFDEELKDPDLAANLTAERVQKLLEIIFAGMAPAQFATLREWVAQFEPGGEDEEIGAGENDTDRPAGGVPKNAAMDAAIKIAPGLANIKIGDDSSPVDERFAAHRHRVPSSSTLEKALEYAPGLANIKIGAV